MFWPLDRCRPRCSPPSWTFAHVLDLDGRAHPEQVSVLPEHSRRGCGSALVKASCSEAARRGYAEIALRTFADVPWNAPCYARLGFLELAEVPGWMQQMLDAERRAGLDRLGRRVSMARPLP